MFSFADRRSGHYLFLVLAGALLVLPNLGAASLWDIDEGNNARCSAEMHAAGNWIIPTFNFELRTDKPALLYWGQITAYRTFGINEFSARLPSALATILAMLIVYELGRHMFGRSAGLLAGVILGSTAGVCGAAHFANPDALLHLCTLAAMWLFYRDYRDGGRSWFLLAPIAAGLAVLAKGPVGVVLPFAAVVPFLAWERRLRLLFDWRLLGGIVVFILVAAPWYVWVGLETKGAWLRGFFLNHNLKRAFETMENHPGPVYYYLLVFSAGFMPWSAFTLPVGWFAATRLRTHDSEAAPDERTHTRFLLCWMAVYLIAFTAARTKLPNYILPLYPAAALLTAGFLDQWRRGRVQPPAWMMTLAFAALLLIGAGVTAGLLVAGGAIPLAALRGRSWPELRLLALLGPVLMLSACFAFWLARRERRTGALTVLAAAAIVFLAGAVGWGTPLMNPYKASQSLAESLPPGQLERDVRLATVGWFQPSLVFYCGRGVQRFDDPTTLPSFLAGPLESYAFLPARTWDELQPRLPSTVRPIGRHYDLYRNCEIVVIANR